MKPIKLEFQGVGPFPKKEVIDFEELLGDGLFLISGPTGSGKTTIFDCITYALYGETSGGERKNNFTSDYLDEKEKKKDAYVYYEFSVRDKLYSIKRTFKVGTRDGKVEFQGDDLILTKKNEVKKYVEEDLLHLKLDEFKKVIMLPQGAFSKFIKESSKEKSALLNSIFDMSIYKELIDRFKNESVEASKEIEEEIKKGVEIVYKGLDIKKEEIILSTDEDIKGYIEMFLQEVKRLEGELKENHLEREGLGISVKVKKIENQREVNKKIALYEENSKKLKELLVDEKDIKEKEEIIKRKEKGDRITPFYSEAKFHRRELEESEDRLLQIVEELEKVDVERLKEEKKEVEETYIKKEKKLRGLEGKEEIYRELEGLEKSLKELEEKKEDIKEEKERSTEEKLELESSINETREKVKKIEGEIERRKELEGKERELEKDLDELEGVKDNLGKLKDLSNREKELEETLKECKENLSKERENQRKALESWYKGSAYDLSRGLKDGESCPVCGSLDHPKKPEKPMDIPEKKEIDELSERCERIEAKKNKVEVDLEKIVFKIKEIGEAIVTYLNIENLFLRSMERLEEEVIKKEEELKEIVKKVLEDLKNLLNEKDKKEMEDYLEILGNKEILLRKNEERILLEEGIISGKLIEGKKQENTLKKKVDLDFNEFKKILEDIREEVQDLEERKKELEKGTRELDSLNEKRMEKANEIEKRRKIVGEKVEKLRESIIKEGFLDEKEYKEVVGKDINGIIIEVEEYREKKLELNLLIKEYSSFKDLKEIDLEKEESILMELRDKDEKLLYIRDEINHKYTSMKESIEELKGIDEVYKKVEGRSKIGRKLYELTSGKIGTHKNLTLDNFILGYYFDLVLSRGNKRLKSMSDGRYEMHLNRDESTGRGYSGLEIDVLDAYTGKKRSIKTLSGGEVFKSAMALALGLSDVVQEQKGGVYLDSLFIDEGFGTLDEESLEGALDILNDLNKGGRVVGVISHVESLKEHIQKQIKVDKGVDGSRLRITSK